MGCLKYFGINRLSLAVGATPRSGVPGDALCSFDEKTRPVYKNMSISKHAGETLALPVLVIQCDLLRHSYFFFLYQSLPRSVPKQTSCLA